MKSNVITSLLLLFIVLSCQKSINTEVGNNQSEQIIKQIASTSSNINLEKGLIAYYPFSGNTNDWSTFKNNAVNLGALPTKDRFNKNNSAYSFAANTNNQIVITQANQINNVKNISISFWVLLNSWNRPGLPGYNRFINKQDPITTSTQFVFANNTTGLYFYYGGFNYFQTNILPSLGQWHNLIVTYNFDGTISNSKCNFYLDGSLKNSFTTSASLVSQISNLYIGSQDASYNTVDGSLDELRFYNRILSQKEITYLATH